MKGFIDKFAGVLAAFAFLLLSSCGTKEEPDPVIITDGNVHLEVNIPDYSVSKAFGDGKSVNTLHYTVFAANNPTEPLKVCPQADGTLSTSGKMAVKKGSNLVTFDLSLPAETGCNIVFWAQNDNAPYTFSAASASVTVDTERLGNNDDSYDAFADKLYVAPLKQGAQTSRNVNLTRPFAQLNIGTDTNDIIIAERAGLVIDNVGVRTMTGTRLNLINMEVTDLKTVTYKAGKMPPRSEYFPIDKMVYLSMCYLLVPPQENINVDLFINPDTANSRPLRTFENVPVQTNYNTDIFGDLLMGDDVFNVIIEPSSGVNFDNKWNGNRNIKLSDNVVNITTRQVRDGLIVSGNGTINLENSSLASSVEGEAAVTITAGSNVLIHLTGSNIITGALNADAIRVEEGASLEITGTSLSAIGNAGLEYSPLNPGYNNTSEASVAGTGGSGIGNSAPSEEVGSIYIHDVEKLSVAGYGVAGFGIGGKNGNIILSNVNVSDARGGFANAHCLNDPNGGVDEPNGAPAIGSSGKGKLFIYHTSIRQAQGGSGCAAIGSSFGSSIEIKITDSTLENITGGNAGAAVGGGRITDSENTCSLSIIDSLITALGGDFAAAVGSGLAPSGNTLPNSLMLTIEGSSQIVATGGKYAAGIGTGFRNASLAGSIAAGVDTSQTHPGTPDIFSADYTHAQAIGFGSLLKSTEAANLFNNFTIAGTPLTSPY